MLRGNGGNPSVEDNSPLDDGDHWSLDDGDSPLADPDNSLLGDLDHDRCCCTLAGNRGGGSCAISRGRCSGGAGLMRVIFVPVSLGRISSTALF